MDRDDLRIGDAEREQTMAALREHFAAGRLTHEELDQRLDQTLAARTGRDLAQVVADLPGHQSAPIPGHDLDWREAMHAHRQQLRAMRHPGKDPLGHPPGLPRIGRHHGPPWSGRRGPGPILPFLFILLMVGLIFGGAGVFKVLFLVWIVAMIMTFASRRFHRRD